MRLELNPPVSAGPVQIGMRPDDVTRALREIPGHLEPAPGEARQPGFGHYESGMSISAGPGRSGVVEAIEVYRPTVGVQVVYRDLGVFNTPAQEVIERLSGMTTLSIEDEGLLVVAPELLMSLWRPVLSEDDDDEDGRYFDSVLVAAPGYYG